MVNCRSFRLRKADEMAHSNNQDGYNEIESSQEENISPIMSQETLQILEKDLPIKNLHFASGSELDVPPEDNCDPCGSQSDRDEYTKIAPRDNSVPGPSNQFNQPSSSGMPPITGAQHSRFINIEGPHKFGIRFDETTEPTKNAPWTYSSQLDKIFVNFNTACPLQIVLQSQPPEGSIIRATPYFKDVEDANYVVERCLTHQRLKEPSNVGFEDKVKHVIRCDSPDTEYHLNPVNGRLSVVTPYRKPETHLELSTMNYYFTCFSSCTGGMNRRAIVVVFSLELRDEVLAQRCFEVRICACPGRDRSKCEKRVTRRLERENRMPVQDLRAPVMFELGSEEGSEMPPPPKRPRVQSDEDYHHVSIAFRVKGLQKKVIYQRILESIKDSAAEHPRSDPEIKRESE